MDGGIAAGVVVVDIGPPAAGASWLRAGEAVRRACLRGLIYCLERETTLYHIVKYFKIENIFKGRN